MLELDESEGYIVLNNLFDFGGEYRLPDGCYVQLNGPQDVCIQIESAYINVPDFFRKVDFRISKMLVTIIALFEDLEKQRLAFFSGDADIDCLGVRCGNTEYARCDFLDKDLMPPVYKYARRRIYVSETLRVLAKNGFKTEEELHHEQELQNVRRQLRFTNYALRIAILGLFASVLVPIGVAKWITGTIMITNPKIVTEIDPSSMWGLKNALVTDGGAQTLDILKQQIKSLSDGIHNLNQKFESVMLQPKVQVPEPGNVPDKNSSPGEQPANGSTKKNIVPISSSTPVVVPEQPAKP